MSRATDELGSTTRPLGRYPGRGPPRSPMRLVSMRSSTRLPAYAVRSRATSGRGIRLGTELALASLPIGDEGGTKSAGRRLSHASEAGREYRAGSQASMPSSPAYRVRARRVSRNGGGFSDACRRPLGAFAACSQPHARRGRWFRVTSIRPSRAESVEGICRGPACAGYAGGEPRPAAGPKLAEKCFVRRGRSLSGLRE